MKKTTLPQLNTSVFVRLTTSKVVVTLIMSTFLLISCSKKDDSTPKESEKSEIKEEIPTKQKLHSLIISKLHKKNSSLLKEVPLIWEALKV
ncbi:hypothetical protein ACI760_04040 [Capnocytophaga canimorsus]|uniref:hypothetical protein n=1 Tax=Capnocytophaga canimorsus TaxID=28188 RepID=UPI00385D2762